MTNKNVEISLDLLPRPFIRPWIRLDGGRRDAQVRVCGVGRLQRRRAPLLVLALDPAEPLKLVVLAVFETWERRRGTAVHGP